MKVLTTAATLAALTVCTLPASAQTKIFTNRTIAGGNPINANAPSGSYIVGQNNSNAFVDNLLVDIVAPTNTNGVQVLRNSWVSVQGGMITALGTRDTSVTTISGGTIFDLGLNGTPTSAGTVAAPTVIVTGGTIGTGVNDSASFGVFAGVLDIRGGTLNGGRVYTDGTALISGGTLTTDSSQDALYVDGQAQISGGTLTGVVRATTAGQVRMIGGTINGGIRGGLLTNGSGSNASGGSIISGGTINSGVVVGVASVKGIDVRGGSFTPYTNSGTTASFINLGVANLAFYGTGLTLSNATSGNLVFNTGGDVTFAGNYYTFTGGRFEDGQSAVGYRLFDATSQGGSPTGYSGGFTLVNTVAAAPEPSGLALLLLPTLGALVARRRKNH